MQREREREIEDIERMIQFKWIDATGNLVNCWVGCCGGTLLIADDISQIARFDMDPSNVSCIHLKELLIARYC